MKKLGNAAAVAGSRGRRLKAPPIVAYPTSVAERDALQSAAASEGGALSGERHTAPAIAAQNREIDEFFGIWKDNPEDGMAFQDRMRSEWD